MDDVEDHAYEPFPVSDAAMVAITRRWLAASAVANSASSGGGDCRHPCRQRYLDQRQHPRWAEMRGAEVVLTLNVDLLMHARMLALRLAAQCCCKAN